MKKQLTLQRLIVAVITMAAEQFAVWAVWRWLLPYYNIHLALWVLIVIMGAWFIAGILIFIAGTGALNQKEVIGLSSMVGVEGEAVGKLAPEGTVKIMGELWNARSQESTIEPGESIIVTGEDGLNLIVEKMKK